MYILRTGLKANNPFIQPRAVNLYHSCLTYKWWKTDAYIPSLTQFNSEYSRKNRNNQDRTILYVPNMVKFLNIAIVMKREYDHKPNIVYSSKRGTNGDEKKNTTT